MGRKSPEPLSGIWAYAYIYPVPVPTSNFSHNPHKTRCRRFVLRRNNAPHEELVPQASGPFTRHLNQHHHHNTLRHTSRTFNLLRTFQSVHSEPIPVRNHPGSEEPVERASSENFLGDRHFSESLPRVSNSCWYTLWWEVWLIEV
uniref:(northern house mosquito) hypothetical protein n=1 Tax=Culex pipiens TaxID=7175 RepID=A0A8D8GJK9_CULPI